MSEHGKVIGPRAVRFERTLPGPIERVWAYLTESDKRATWFSAGEMELRSGGKIEFHFNHAALTPHNEEIPDKYKEAVSECEHSTGRVTRCDPPRLLAFEWDEPSGGASEVTFELTPRGENVLLTLTHERLTSRDEMLEVSGGWHAHLDILADRLHGRAPEPFWAKLLDLDEAYQSRIPKD